MSDETLPRGEDGLQVCAWCGDPIRQPPTGRRREYCSRSCRQRAYEERQVQQRIAEATAAAVAEQEGSEATAQVSSRDETDVVPRDESDASRDDEGRAPGPGPWHRGF